VYKEKKMQAVVNIDSVKVADVFDKSPTTGMMLETKTRKVLVVYSIPEKNMTRQVQVNHPATVEQIKAAVLDCYNSCMAMEAAATQYKTDLTNNNTIEL
jgi:hypothetical protein